MMLLILDKNPIVSANLVPDKLKFKQLLELAQMVCSCGYSNIYKTVKQGQKIQQWIKNNTNFVWYYYNVLLDWCIKNINMKNKTVDDLVSIHSKIPTVYYPYDANTVVFRFMKEYKGNTKYDTDSEIPADIGIKEYKKYLEWKGYKIKYV